MTSEIRVAGLTDANDQDPGIRRRRFGTGFSYVDFDGAPTGDAYLREALGEALGEDFSAKVPHLGRLGGCGASPGHPARGPSGCRC